MEHPADGMIRACLDGEETQGAESLRVHLAECHRCGEVAREQARVLETLSHGLTRLDVDPALERARARVLREGAKRRGPGPFLRRNLSRAASVALLLTAGAAAALPSSPVRRWVESGWGAVSGAGEPAAPASPGEAGEQSVSGRVAPERVGATVPASLDGLELHVRGLPQNASLRILLVEGAQAGIFAGEGTRFRTEAGRLEASGPPGDVTMEIPIEASRVLVVVNGETYLMKSEEGLELLGPVRTRTPTEIRFGPSPPGSNPPPSGG